MTKLNPCDSNHQEELVARTCEVRFLVRDSPQRESIHSMEGKTMRRVVTVGMTAIIASLGPIAGLWSGPCFPTGDCSDNDCRLVDVIEDRCCVWDHGCFFNPFTPNNQEWCETVHVYGCSNAQLCWQCYETHEAEECGPCCEAAGPIPQPVPLPVAPVAP